MAAQRLVQGLADIHDKVADMADLARGMLRDGVQSLVVLDRQRGQEVYDRREALADIDEEIETEILEFLTLQSPVARDLRATGAAMKLITYLNRVGRYGSDIARIAVAWPEGSPHIDRLVNIQEMAEKTQHMLDIVLQAFNEDQAPNLQAIRELEDDVDDMRKTVWRACLTWMAQDPKHIEPCANYMMVARYLERTGDNICKMAEKQHYAATGERVLI